MKKFKCIPTLLLVESQLSTNFPVGCSKLLHFIDDQVVMAEDKDVVSYMLRKLDGGYTKWSHTINTDRTKYVVGGSVNRNLTLGGKDAQEGS